MKDITFTFPEKPPKVYFTRDVNYLETGLMTVKAKYADGTDFFLLNPKKKVIMTAPGLFFEFYIYRFGWEDTEGIYTAELRKGSTVVASDTTIVKHFPPCEEGYQECIHGDLWKCVNEAMKLVEKSSKACVRDGFYNTNESVPSVLRLDVGTKDIMITKGGYEDLILNNLEVLKGKTTSVAGIMVPKIRGYISCNSTPSGAGIWVKEIWTTSQAVATATEITKSEFIAEIQKLGKIKLSKLKLSGVYGEWLYNPSLFGGIVRYVIYNSHTHRDRGMSIGNINIKNPPTDVKDIFFTDSGLPFPKNETETFDREDALGAIGKLPFIGFGFTSKVTPATIPVNPKTYAVKFKLDGYKEKVVSSVIVKEGQTTSVSVTLEKAEAPPSECTTDADCPSGYVCKSGKCVKEGPLPPEAVKFGLSEIVDNHLPGWITGYACGECGGRWWEYKCPAGYKRTECRSEPVGSHGCCSRCSVIFVKCESVAAPPPVTPPPSPPVVPPPPSKAYLQATSSPSGARIWLKKR